MQKHFRSGLLVLVLSAGLASTGNVVQAKEAAFCSMGGGKPGDLPTDPDDKDKPFFDTTYFHTLEDHTHYGIPGERVPRGNDYRRSAPERIDRVVLHNGGLMGKPDAETIMSHMIATWKKSRETSSHFFIGETGKIYAFVNIECTAIHAKTAGDRGGKLNLASIGIDLPIPECDARLGDTCPPDRNKHKYKCDGNISRYPKPLLDSLNRLLKFLAKNTRVKLDDTHILGHFEVASRRRADPVCFPWEAIGLKKDQHTSGGREKEYPGGT